MRILIVDDAPIETAVLTRIVRGLGHEVSGHASDLPGALEMAAKFGPNLAIVDGRLPGEGCLDAVRRLREASPAIAVAVVASLAELDLVRAAVAAGAVGALRRPLLRDQVDEALRSLQPSTEKAPGSGN